MRALTLRAVSLVLSLTCLVTRLLPSRGLAVEESSSGAILSFPDVSDGDLYNVTWEVEPAAFGYADYGGTLEAFLVLPKNVSWRTQCDLEEDGTNPYIHLINDYEGSDALWIMAIDRGDCYFATKVYNAEELGADGVIVLDNTQEDLFPMWEPDNFEHDIEIPSVELQYDNAQRLMEHLGVVGWDPSSSDYEYPIPVVSEGVDFANGTEFVITKVIIEWGLPHEDDKVEWEMWTQSNDDRTMEFKRNFKTTALYLDYQNYTFFTPHYYILNGEHWNCETKKLRCGYQCSNSGRYCAVDPNGVVDDGVEGIHVIQEDLRQLCIWNFTTHGHSTKHNESVWWDYSVLWNDNCYNSTEDETKFTEECSFQQMATLEEMGATGLSAYVNNCINATGGYGYHDGNNTFLEYEVRFRERLSVHVLPSFRVNEFMIYGEVDCDEVTEDGCSILDSICSGFLEGTEPDLCYNTPSPTAHNCSADLKDCDDVCFGSSETDRCGECRDPTKNSWNKCVGCDNVTNSGFKTNHCGYCINKTRDDFDTYGEGCDEVCDSNYNTDSCGECRWIYGTDWNECVGCDGVANSGKVWNDCGSCILSTTAGFATYGCDDSSNGGNSSDIASLSSATIIIGVVSFLVIVFAGLVIYKLFKKQKEQTRQMDSIIKTYTLMDENPSGNGGGASGNSRNPFQRKKGRMPVPTDDIDNDNEDNGAQEDELQ